MCASLGSGRNADGVHFLPQTAPEDRARNATAVSPRRAEHSLSPGGQVWGQDSLGRGPLGNEGCILDLFFFFSLKGDCLQCCIRFRCTTYWFYSSVNCWLLPKLVSSLLPYNVLLILLTISYVGTLHLSDFSYNWKFVLFNPLNFAYPPPTSLLATSSSPYLIRVCFLVPSFVFDSTCK